MYRLLACNISAKFFPCVRSYSIACFCRFMRGLLPTLYCPLIVMMYLHSVADHKAGQGPLLSNAVDNCKLDTSFCCIRVWWLLQTLLDHAILNRGSVNPQPFVLSVRPFTAEIARHSRESTRHCGKYSPRLTLRLGFRFCSPLLPQQLLVLPLRLSCKVLASQLVSQAVNFLLKINKLSGTGDTQFEDRW